MCWGLSLAAGKGVTGRTPLPLCLFRKGPWVLSFWGPPWANLQFGLFPSFHSVCVGGRLSWEELGPAPCGS